MSNSAKGARAKQPKPIREQYEPAHGWTGHNTNWNNFDSAHGKSPGGTDD